MQEGWSQPWPAAEEVPAYRTGAFRTLCRALKVDTLLVSTLGSDLNLDVHELGLYEGRSPEDVRKRSGQIRTRSPFGTQFLLL